MNYNDKIQDQVRVTYCFPYHTEPRIFADRVFQSISISIHYPILFHYSPNLMFINLTNLPNECI